MPRGDKSSYSGKQRRQAHDIEKSYEKRGVSNDEAERRAWATVNKESGGAKGKSSHSKSHSHGGSHSKSDSHSGSHSHRDSHSGNSGHHKSSRSRHSGSHSGTSHRSRGRSKSSHSSSRSRSRSRGRSRSRNFTLFGLKLPKSTPYILGGLGLCGLVYGLLQIDTISEAVDPVIDDIGEFFGITEKPDMMVDQSFTSPMSTIQ